MNNTPLYGSPAMTPSTATSCSGRSVASSTPCTPQTGASGTDDALDQRLVEKLLPCASPTTPTPTRCGGQTAGVGNVIDLTTTPNQSSNGEEVEVGGVSLRERMVETFARTGPVRTPTNQRVSVNSEIVESSNSTRDAVEAGGGEKRLPKAEEEDVCFVGLVKAESTIPILQTTTATPSTTSNSAVVVSNPVEMRCDTLVRERSERVRQASTVPVNGRYVTPTRTYNLAMRRRAQSMMPYVRPSRTVPLGRGVRGQSRVEVGNVVTRRNPPIANPLAIQTTTTEGGNMTSATIDDSTISRDANITIDISDSSDTEQVTITNFLTATEISTATREANQLRREILANRRRNGPLNLPPSNIPNSKGVYSNRVRLVFEGGNINASRHFTHESAVQPTNLRVEQMINKLEEYVTKFFPPPQRRKP